MATSCLRRNSNTLALDKDVTAKDTSLSMSQCPEKTLQEQPNIAVFLPRHTSLPRLAACLEVLRTPIEPLCLERNVLNNQLKALTLYTRVL